ncbi:hypothetical protein NP233_g8381 [Leucocoprinus birnbaumii]|uniref:AB hydrolase-1 domain-containing protein n=1 Tax=Leucocoprinus birnbaumii TaxID=56174 RepID=A0AAD5VMF6_9AGAR|nr:hypothetical protein NP233_g8381 [Leucocoprinus birnbaumii]
MLRFVRCLPSASIRSHRICISPRTPPLQSLRTLQTQAKMSYPPIEPFETGQLKVSDIHTLYYEISGNKDGNPVVFVHGKFPYLSSSKPDVDWDAGGPGGGTDVKDRTFFNPEKYKIILFDQRGAGKSTPSASLEENTTWDLVKDIERLREKLGVEKWHVFGGSWVQSLYFLSPSWFSLIVHPGFHAFVSVRSGDTLSMGMEVITHPDKLDPSRKSQDSCHSWYFHTAEEVYFSPLLWPTSPHPDLLMLSELRFFYQDGASHLFPEAWDEYIAPVPENERDDMMKAYHKLLTSSDEATQIRAAKAWSKWEMATSKLFVDPSLLHHAEEDKFALAFARIENHYFVNEGFMRDGQLLEKQSIDKIRHIPTVIVQGRYDVVCPATTAYALKKVFPEATLQIVPDAGHSSRETGTLKLLVEATDKFADI